MGKHRADGVRSFGRNYREVLSDAKFSFEDGDVFLDGFQVERFGAGVNDGLEFDSWNLLQRELNRLVPLHSAGIDVYVRREFDFVNQSCPATTYSIAIRLFT